MPILVNRGIARPPRGPFSYPGIEPRFDPSHIAAGITRFSAVAFNGTNLVNLLNGAQGTIGGSPTSVEDGTLGHCFRGNAGTVFVNFTGQSTANDSDVTFGWMWRPAASNANMPVFASDGAATNGAWVGGSNPGRLIIVANSGGAFKQSSGGVTYVTGSPYFCAVSMNSSVTNFVLTNLETGVTKTSTTTGTALTAPNGTYRIGLNNTFHLNNTSVAAVMFAGQYSSMNKLLQWAADPWAFWYPR